MRQFDSDQALPSYMDHILTVQPQYLTNISNGTKRVEGRVNKPKFQALRADDRIIFQDPNATYTVITSITFIHHYPSFQAMLEQEGLHTCLPNIASVAEGVALYHSFPRYREDEQTFGVIAIGLVLTK